MVGLWHINAISYFNWLPIHKFTLYNFTSRESQKVIFSGHSSTSLKCCATSGGIFDVGGVSAVYIGWIQWLKRYQHITYTAGKRNLPLLHKKSENPGIAKSNFFFGIWVGDGNSLESQHMQQKHFPYNSINIWTHNIRTIIIIQFIPCSPVIYGVDTYAYARTAYIYALWNDCMFT